MPSDKNQPQPPVVDQPVDDNGASKVHALIDEMRKEQKNKLLGKIGSGFTMLSLSGLLALGVAFFYPQTLPNQVLQTELPQTGSQSEIEAEYVSQQLRLKFFYPKNKISFVETDDEINFNLSSSDITGQISVSTDDLQTTQTDLQKKYTDLFGELQYVVNVDPQTSITVIDFSYQLQSLSSEVNTTYYRQILLKSINDQIVVADFASHIAFTLNSNNSIIKEILNSAQLPAKQDQQLGFYQDSVVITYPKSDWDQAKTNSETVVSFNHSKDPNVNYTVEIVPLTENDLGAQKQLAASASQFVIDNPDYAIVQEASKATISQIDGFVTQLKNTKNQNLTDIYLIKMPLEGSYFKLSVNYPSAKSSLVSDLVSYFNIIKLTDLPQTGGEIWENEPNYYLSLASDSVVLIYNQSCTSVTFKSQTKFKSLASKAYQICSTQSGSGFVVSESGDIVSVSHLTAPHPVDIVIDSLLQDDSSKLYKDMLVLAQDNLDSKYSDTAVQTLSDYQTTELLKQMMVGFFADQQNQASEFEFSQTTYANKLIRKKIFPETQLDSFLKDTNNYLDLELVNYNTVESLYTLTNSTDQNLMLSKSDLALLRINDKTVIYPALMVEEIAQSNIGGDVFAIGFGGNTAEQAIIDNYVYTTLSTIKSLNPSANNAFNTIHLTSSLFDSTNGGPILNEKGSVLGVATSLINAKETSTFDTALSSTDLINFLGTNQVNYTQNVLTQKLKSAVDDYYKKDYQSAYTKLSEADTTITADAQNLADLLLKVQVKKDSKVVSQKQIVFNLMGIEFENKHVYVLAASGILLLLGIVFLLAWMSRSKQLKNQAAANPKNPSTNPNPYTTLVQANTNIVNPEPTQPANNTQLYQVAQPVSAQTVSQPTPAAPLQ